MYHVIISTFARFLATQNLLSFRLIVAAASPRSFHSINHYTYFYLDFANFLFICYLAGKATFFRTPIIADLVLQDIEKKFSFKYKKSITCYLRYVDDSFIVIIKNKLPLLVKFLNNVHCRLNFTVEKEEEKQDKNKISFLDLLVERKQDGSITLDLYKKKTFSREALSSFFQSMQFL